MAVDLTAPLSWKTATGDAATMLDELQPNILKAHVRDFLTVLFLHFADPAEGKSFLAALVPLMKSAADAGGSAALDMGSAIPPGQPSDGHPRCGADR